jgi:hypothetical protein
MTYNLRMETFFKGPGASKGGRAAVALPPHASHCGCGGDSVVVLPRLAAPVWGPGGGEPEAPYRPSKYRPIYYGDDGDPMS